MGVPVPGALVGGQSRAFRVPGKAGLVPQNAVVQEGISNVRPLVLELDDRLIRADGFVELGPDRIPCRVLYLASLDLLIDELKQLGSSRGRPPMGRRLLVRWA